MTTLQDLASRTELGSISVVAEVLSQSNPIIKDIPLVECNDKTGHKSTIRTGLAEASWRKLNYGVKQSKNQTQQVRDSCGMLETNSRVDNALLKLAKDKAAFLKSENDGYLESMSQEWAKTLFYGDTTKTPEKFMGFMPRYNTISGKAAAVKNVISAGSTKATGNRSVVLVGWGEDKVFGIYPEGSHAGIEHEDLGVSLVEDPDKGEYMAYRNHYELHTGLCVKDWRYVVRICNIDPETITGKDLLALMVEAKRRIPDIHACKPVWYMSREIATLLENALLNNTSTHVTIRDVENGLPELMISRVPVHECDALDCDEAKVS